MVMGAAHSGAVALTAFGLGVGSSCGCAFGRTFVEVSEYGRAEGALNRGTGFGCAMGAGYGGGMGCIVGMGTDKMFPEFNKPSPQPRYYA